MKKKPNTPEEICAATSLLFMVMNNSDKLPLVSGIRLEPMPGNKRPEGYYYVQFRNKQWSIARWNVINEIGFWTIVGDDMEYWDQQFKTIVEKQLPLPNTENGIDDGTETI